MKTLIISGHPDLSTSVANQTILDELEKAFPDAEIRKLDQLYPTANIDVDAEQKALLEADLIVWQFPFWWYSLPWLMKKWLDEVFLHGFAHGSTGKLGGKKLLVSFTTGHRQKLIPAAKDLLVILTKCLKCSRQRQSFAASITRAHSTCMVSVIPLAMMNRPLRPRNRLLGNMQQNLIARIQDITA